MLKTGGLGSANFGRAGGTLGAGMGKAPRFGAVTEPASIANSYFLFMSVMKAVPMAYFGFLLSFISSLNFEYCDSSNMVCCIAC